MMIMMIKIMQSIIITGAMIMIALGGELSLSMYYKAIFLFVAWAMVMLALSLPQVFDKLGKWAEQ